MQDLSHGFSEEQSVYPVLSSAHGAFRVEEESLRSRRKAAWAGAAQSGLGAVGRALRSKHMLPFLVPPRTGNAMQCVFTSSSNLCPLPQITVHAKEQESTPHRKKSQPVETDAEVNTQGH